MEKSSTKASKQFNKDDFKLWKQFKDGDQKALSSIYLLHYDLLFNYTNRLINNSEETKDLIQELFLKLWNNRSKLSDCNVISYYLITAIRGLVIDRIRKQSKTFKVEITDSRLPPELPFDKAMIESQDEENLLARIQNAINKLGNRQREAIFLRIYEDIEYEEVAKIMGLNVQSVRNLIHTGLQSLKQLLK